MTTLINGIYPITDLTLDQVDQIKSPSQYWWASAQRFASVNPGNTSKYLARTDNGLATREILEVDLERVRQINYISFQVLRGPMDIKIEYDIISANDGTHKWVEVQPVTGELFTSDLHYDNNTKNAWFNAEFYVQDPNYEIINTQFIRITFQRKDVKWPTKNSGEFRWPIAIKNLRTSRYVTSIADTIGDLILSPPTTMFQNLATTNDEVRQQFTIAGDAARGNIDPNIMGFSVFCDLNINLRDAQDFIDAALLNAFSMRWSVWDVTDTPTLLKSGVETNAVTDDKLWVDVYFDPKNPIPTSSSSPRILELRVSSNNLVVWQNVGMQQANIFDGINLVGDYVWVSGTNTINILNGVTDPTTVFEVGDYIMKQNHLDGAYQINGISYNTLTGLGQITLTNIFHGVNETTSVAKALPSAWVNGTTGVVFPDFTKSMCIRVWGDVGDQGQDFLGNSYRSGARISSADNVLVQNNNIGWMSQAQPSPEAVQSLYFDVRQLVGGVPKAQVIDAIQVAPKTFGLRMHVYYTQVNVNSLNPDGSLRAPLSQTEWDQMLWKPINTTYTLRTNQTYELPQPITAAFVKLEFSNLIPMPIKIPKKPTVRATNFNRYPTWIETQFENAQIKRVVQDWFVKNRTQVEVNVLKTMTDPILEFQYKEREFLAALALGKIKQTSANASLVNVKQKTLIDPTTASMIKFQTADMYKGTLTATVNQNSLLGATVIDRFNPTLNGDPVEGQVNSSAQVPNVSTTNDRISESFAHLAQTPMWFNKTSRHVYKIESAVFGTQGYYAGINNVSFSRKNYAILRDDALISDNFSDNSQLEENTFIPDSASLLAKLISSGAATITLYVSYTVGDTRYTDEMVMLNSLTGSVVLAGLGSPATNVVVNSMPNNAGSTYTYGVDYDITYSTDFITGDTTNNIQVSTYSQRLVVTNIKDFTDRNTVLGKAVISADEVFVGHGAVSDTSAVTVTGTAVISAVLSAGYKDAGTVSATGITSGVEVYTSIHTNIDANTVVGVTVPSGADIAIFNEAGTIIPETTPGIVLHQGSSGVEVLDTIGAAVAYPDLNLYSVWVKWSTLMPNNFTFNWPAALDASIDDAETNGYKIVFRVAAGPDIPTWVYSDPTNPVQSVVTIGTDLVSGQITLPVYWDTDYLFWYKALLDYLAVQFHATSSSGLTTAGNRRRDQIIFMPMTMGMETSNAGSMHYPYGHSAVTYSATTTTLSAFLNGAAMSFSVADATGFPTGTFLIKIDTELLSVTRSGNTFTVNPSGRGWSGSTANSHSAGATVNYALTGTWTGTYNGFTGVWDPAQLNKSVWLALGTETSNDNSYIAAMGLAIDAQVAKISNPTGVPTCLPIGLEFADAGSNIVTLVSTKTLSYPTQLWIMGDQLIAGNSAGAATKNSQATYYAGAYLPLHQAVSSALAHGSPVGFHTAPYSDWQLFSNPFTGSGSAFRLTFEDTMTIYTPNFFEVTSDILLSS